MMEHNLRFVLAQVDSHLTQKDVKRFLFCLSTMIPPRIRDESSHRGFLEVIDYLFEQEKISETHFDLLIDTFKKIGCKSAEGLLNDYKRQIQSKDARELLFNINSETPLIENPLLEEQQNDKYSAHDIANVIRTKCDARSEIIQENQEDFLSKSTQVNNSNGRLPTIDSFHVRTDLRRLCLQILLGILLIGIVTIITIVIQHYSSLSKLNSLLNSTDDNCSYSKRNLEDFLSQIKDLKNESDLQKQENARLSKIVQQKNALIENLIQLQNEINQTTVRLQSLQKNNTERFQQFENQNKENSQKRTSLTRSFTETNDYYNFNNSIDFTRTTPKKLLWGYSNIMELSVRPLLLTFFPLRC